MPRPSTGNYPWNWAIIALSIDRGQDYVVLTVHHLDLNKSNCAWWNLVALCQRCHLQIQHKIVMERYWMFDHSSWFIPYVAGYYAHQLQLPEDREYVTQNADQILRQFIPQNGVKK